MFFDVVYYSFHCLTYLKNERSDYPLLRKNNEWTQFDRNGKDSFLIWS